MGKMDRRQDKKPAPPKPAPGQPNTPVKTEAPVQPPKANPSQQGCK